MLTYMSTNKFSSAEDGTKKEVTDSQNDQVSNIMPDITPPEELPDPRGDKKQTTPEDERRKLYNLYVNKWYVGSKPEDVSEESYDEQTQILEASRITTKTPLKHVETLLSIGGISVFEREDTYLIKGDPKSGKSTLCKVIIGAILRGECCGVKAERPGLKIAYIDTEQKVADTQDILTYVRKLVGDNVTANYIDSHLKLYGLRMRDYTQLIKDMLRIAIDERPDIIICDGIADFVPSFNDENASRAIILLQLRIIEEFNCAIINLIHENKARDDHNPKGHLGQLSKQKGAIVIGTKKEGEIITAKCDASRHKTMPTLYLMYDEDGMICDATEPYKAQAKAKADAEKKKFEYKKIALSIISEAGGQIKRSELGKKMAEKTGLSRPWMSSIVTELLENDLFLVDDMVQATSQTELNF